MYRTKAKNQNEDWIGWTDVDDLMNIIIAHRWMENQLDGTNIAAISWKSRIH